MSREDEAPDALEEYKKDPQSIYAKKNTAGVREAMFKFGCVAISPSEDDSDSASTVQSVANHLSTNPSARLHDHGAALYNVETSEQAAKLDFAVGVCIPSIVSAKKMAAVPCGFMSSADAGSAYHQFSSGDIPIDSSSFVALTALTPGQIRVVHPGYYPDGLKGKMSDKAFEVTVGAGTIVLMRPRHYFCLVPSDETTVMFAKVSFFTTTLPARSSTMLAEERGWITWISGHKDVPLPAQSWDKTIDSDEEDEAERDTFWTRLLVPEGASLPDLPVHTICVLNLNPPCPAWVMKGNWKPIMPKFIAAASKSFDVASALGHARTVIKLVEMAIKTSDEHEKRILSVYPFETKTVNVVNLQKGANDFRASILAKSKVASTSSLRKKADRLLLAYTKWKSELPERLDFLEKAIRAEAEFETLLRLYSNHIGPIDNIPKLEIWRKRIKHAFTHLSSSGFTPAMKSVLALKRDINKESDKFFSSQARAAVLGRYQDQSVYMAYSKLPKMLAMNAVNNRYTQDWGRSVMAFRDQLIESGQEKEAEALSALVTEMKRHKERLSKEMNDGGEDALFDLSRICSIFDEINLRMAGDGKIPSKASESRDVCPRLEDETCQGKGYLISSTSVPDLIKNGGAVPSGWEDTNVCRCVADMLHQSFLEWARVHEIMDNLSLDEVTESLEEAIRTFRLHKTVLSSKAAMKSGDTAPIEEEEFFEFKHFNENAWIKVDNAFHKICDEKITSLDHPAVVSFLKYRDTYAKIIEKEVGSIEDVMELGGYDSEEDEESSDSRVEGDEHNELSGVCEECDGSLLADGRCADGCATGENDRPAKRPREDDVASIAPTGNASFDQEILASVVTRAVEAAMDRRDQKRPKLSTHLDELGELLIHSKAPQAAIDKLSELRVLLQGGAPANGSDKETSSPWQAVMQVGDLDKVIYSADSQKDVVAYLSKHYPDWRNPSRTTMKIVVRGSG